MWTATKANMVYMYRIRSSGGKNVFTVLKLVFGEVPNLIKVIYPIGRRRTSVAGAADSRALAAMGAARPWAAWAGKNTRVGVPLNHPDSGFFMEDERAET
jgi:hypothetical protein